MFQNTTDSVVAEMQEFAGLEPYEQRFIKQSLYMASVARHPEAASIEDVVGVWARGEDEEYLIRRQWDTYCQLPKVDRLTPSIFGYQYPPEAVAIILTMISVDLKAERISCFAAYHFLYERLLGPHIRPWLLCMFLWQATQPHLTAQHRESLFDSTPLMEVTATQWDNTASRFFPFWVEADGDDTGLVVPLPFQDT